ncbi:MAG TPA: hypothetical protein VMW50_10750 [Dehalococcoidia bacterium]|nr:hypothetical protein [Dehalococcoidia bacterium]
MKKEKKSHGVQLLIRTVVKDPEGKVLSDIGQKPSKSFVIQFLEFLRFLFHGAATSKLATDTDGLERGIYRTTEACSATFFADAGVNESLWGIVVGTGDTAETNTDYKLDTQLGEGAGAGQITHGAMTIGITAVVGANVDLELKRAFTNNTGSAIIVKEAGVYVRCSYAVVEFCIVRDVLLASINVPDRCSLSVYYTLRTTV